MGVVVHLLEVVVAELVLLLQRVEAYWGLVRLQDPAHSDVPLEVYPDQVPCLLLVPVRTDPDVLDGGDFRVGCLRERYPDLDLEGDVGSLHGRGVRYDRLDHPVLHGGVRDSHPHEVVDYLPVLLGASLWPVDSRYHRAVVHSVLDPHALSELPPVVAGAVHRDDVPGIGSACPLGDLGAHAVHRGQGAGHRLRCGLLARC